MAFALLLIVVISSTVYTYQITYSANIQGTVDDIQRITGSVSTLYDAVYGQICAEAEQVAALVLDPNVPVADVQGVMDAVVDRSPFITDVALVTSQGSVTNTDQVFPLAKHKVDGFLLGKEPGLCVGMVKGNLRDQNIFYAVNVMEDNNKDVKLLLIGLDYDVLNQVIGPEKFEVHDGYAFMMSKDGFFLYHSDPKLIGLNIFQDPTKVKEVAHMEDHDLEELSKALTITLAGGTKKALDYRAYGQDKTGFYQHLETFNGVVFMTVDETRLHLNQWKAVLRTVLPQLICLVLGIYVMSRYIFLIKYTDYFTEVKNDRAYKLGLDHRKRAGVQKEKHLIVRVDTVLKGQVENTLYDNEIFYHVSGLFKSLKGAYKDLYRISRVHYVMVLPSASSQEDLDKLLSKINKPYTSKSGQEYAIRGKYLLVDIGDLQSLEDMDLGHQVIQYLDHHGSRIGERGSCQSVDINHVLDQLASKKIEKEAVEQLIADRNIQVVYQPIVELKTMKTVKHEALMRVKDKNRLLPPSDFIRVAEEHNLVHKIDQIVIQQAFAHYAKALRNTGRGVSLSINVSGKSINRDFAQFIIEAASRNQVNPEYITIELTETAALNFTDQPLECLHFLRSKGFKLAIDDFGTGYAHVELLSQIQVDYIKIDGAFITSVHSDEKRLKTLNALVYLCKNYETQIIAEHVDSLEVVRVLERMEVEYGQGYYLGKPETGSREAVDYYTIRYAGTSTR